MITTGTSLSAVSPFTAIPQKAISNEPIEDLNSSIKPVLQTQESADIEQQANRSTLSQTPDAEESSEASDQADQEEAIERRQLEIDQQQIQQLAARDREVRTHEQAHAAVGGPYAGAPRYQFERGPDGVRYAVGGEVSIDVGAEATPEATITKAQVVRRAALAPAEPSPQDRAVAAEAASLEIRARQELQREQIEVLEEQNTRGDSDDIEAFSLDSFANAEQVDTVNGRDNATRISQDNDRQAPPSLSSRINNAIGVDSGIGSLLSQLV